MLQMSHSAGGAWACHVTDRRSISEARFLFLLLQIACFLLARFLLGSTGHGLEGDTTPFLRNSTEISSLKKISLAGTYGRISGHASAFLGLQRSLGLPAVAQPLHHGFLLQV